MEGKIKFYQKINQKINIIMFHGQKDEVVPIFQEKFYQYFLWQKEK